MRRYLETLFRHKRVFLIPALAIPLIGIFLAVYSERAYEVSAAVWVEPSPFLDPLNTPPSQRSANEIEAQAMRERLATEAFRKEVMDRTGLTDAIMNGKWPAPSRLWVEVNNTPGLAKVPGVTLPLRVLGMAPPSSTSLALARGMDMIEDSLTVSTDENKILKNQNLITITYKGKEPELGKRLIEETIALHNEETLESQTEAAKLGVEFYTNQVRNQAEKAIQAAEAQTRFLELHPPPILGQFRPGPEQVELDSLTRNVLWERTVYEATSQQLDLIKLNSLVSISNRNQSFNIVDPPLEPQTTFTTKRSIIMGVVFGIVLGFAVGMVPIILLTWVDSTVRTKGEIQEVLNTPLVTEVPVVFMGSKKKRDLVRKMLARGAA